MSEQVDCVVIGAGVVGLAVAARLAEMGRDVVVLEQHDLIGSETSSRNSEVIHAGIYYPRDSLKAKLCVRGKRMLYQHCRDFGVPHQQCGKLIVAANEAQIDTVKGYIQKARENGVDDLHWLTQDEVQDMEPEVRSVGGVLSPSTGIIDSHSFMVSLQGQLERHGGVVAFNSRVLRLRADANGNTNGVLVETSDMTLSANCVINSAGLYAPELATHLVDGHRAYYAKGHYYAYSGAQPFSRLVYPVAEPGGLGVHVTLDMAGQVKFGPDVRWLDTIDYAFQNEHFDDFVAAISAYYPNLDATRLHPSYTGIRPKLAPAGGPFQDFVIAGPADHGVKGLVNLLGIESPGLTASLAIAEVVGDIVGSQPGATP